jgi:seryl-tRNA synthetase
MIAERDKLRKQVNQIQNEKITPKMKAKEDCTAEVAEMKAVLEEMKAKEAPIPELEAARDKLLNRIGNMVDPEVPISDNEEQDNLVITLHPTPPEGDAMLPAPQGDWNIPCLPPNQ